MQCTYVSSAATPLTEDNLDQILGTNYLICLCIFRNVFNTVLISMFKMRSMLKKEKTCIVNSFHKLIVDLILLCFAAANELVLVNFYAEWCRFSNLLQPIFDEAADKVKETFPEPGKVVMGKVDCDREGK